MSAFARASDTEMVIGFDDVTWMTEPLRVNDTPDGLKPLMMFCAMSAVLIRFSVTVDPLVTTGATAV